MAERGPRPAPPTPGQTQVGPFERETAVRPLEREGDSNRFAAHVADGWRAGRGPHGGYLAAIILRALTQALDDAARAPRSLTIHFLAAPQEGQLVIDVVMERAGRSLSTLSARMTQDGRPMALALAAFSVPWEGPELSELEMPAVEGPSSERRPGALIPPDRGGPPFGRHIVFQPRIGGLPFTDGPAAMETGGWIGLIEPRPLDAPALAFYTDALIPTPFMRVASFMPAPTIDITIHFRTAVPRGPATDTPDLHELVFACTRGRLVHEGFFEEDSMIWGQDGTLLAQSRQLALLIG